MENVGNKIIQRYFRKTPAHPEGSVVHHGDCDFFSIKICTCGLHHDMLVLESDQQMEHYSLFYLERMEYEKVREHLMHPGGSKKKKA